jgi:hypothetical protein
MRTWRRLPSRTGLVPCSSDSDFARLPNLRWIDPLIDPAPLS